MSTDEKKLAESPPQPRWQFSLRGMLICTVLVAAVVIMRADLPFLLKPAIIFTVIVFVVGCVTSEGFAWFGSLTWGFAGGVFSAGVARSMLHWIDAPPDYVLGLAAGCGFLCSYIVCEVVSHVRRVRPSHTVEQSEAAAPENQDTQ